MIVNLLIGRVHILWVLGFWVVAMNAAWIIAYVDYRELHNSFPISWYRDWNPNGREDLLKYGMLVYLPLSLFFLWRAISYLQVRRATFFMHHVVTFILFALGVGASYYLYHAGL